MIWRNRLDICDYFVREKTKTLFLAISSLLRVFHTLTVWDSIVPSWTRLSYLMSRCSKRKKPVSVFELDDINYVFLESSRLCISLFSLIPENHDKLKLYMIEICLKKLQ